MRGRLDKSRTLAAVAALLISAGVSSLATAQSEIRFFTIGTAATGGTYFPIGALIANVISNPPGSRPCDRGGSCGVPGLIAVAQSTQGSLENVRRLGPRDLQSALSQSDVASWAYSGTGIFKGQPPLVNLRSIASLYPEDVHIVVRRDSGIRAIEDLRGKRVSLGEQDSGTRVEAEIILEHYGIGLADIQPSFERPGNAADRLERSEIDAFFHVSGSPVIAVTQLSERVAIDLLPINLETATEIVGAHPFFALSAITAGSYEGVGEIPTLSVRAVWLVDVSIDEDLVHAITGSLWHEANRGLLDAGHPRGRIIRRDTALDGLAVPLHAGAERYYRENGFLD